MSNIVYIHPDKLKMGTKLICRDANISELDDGELTQGKEYSLLWWKIINGTNTVGIYLLLRVINDKGFEEDYKSTRFILA